MVEVRRKTERAGGKRRDNSEKKTNSEYRLSVGASPTNVSREEIFESLRSSSGSRQSTTGAASLEERERAKVESRSLEGIRQQMRKNGNTNDGAGTTEEKIAKSRVSTRLSSSIDSLPVATKLSDPPSALSRQRHTGRNAVHGSHDRLLQPFQRRLPQQTRPFSEIYVGRDQSLSTREKPGRTKSPELPVSPEEWELDGRGALETALSLSQPDNFNLAQISPLAVAHSSLTHSLSRSVDHGLDPAPATRQVSHSHSGSNLNQEGRGSGRSPTSPGSSYTLPRTKKQSLTHSPPASPTPPPLPSVPPPSSVTTVNQPTFVPPVRGRPLRKPPPAHPVPESESLAAEISDLHDRIILLSNQLLYEKADVYTRLHRAGQLSLPPSLPPSLSLSYSLPPLSPSLSHTHTPTISFPLFLKSQPLPPLASNHPRLYFIYIIQCWWSTERVSWSHAHHIHMRERGP